MYLNTSKNKQPSKHHLAQFWEAAGRSRARAEPGVSRRSRPRPVAPTPGRGRVECRRSGNKKIKMISIQEYYNNKNQTINNITKQEYIQERYGYCRYLIDLSSLLKIPNEVASVALIYMNKFFIKNSFFNYDKN